MPFAESPSNHLLSLALYMLLQVTLNFGGQIAAKGQSVIAKGASLRLVSREGWGNRICSGLGVHWFCWEKKTTNDHSDSVSHDTIFS